MSTLDGATDAGTTEPERPSPTRPAVAGGDELARTLVLLLKGVVYRSNDPVGWDRLVTLQARARDYLAVLGLDLVIDESEGYAYVRSRAGAEADAADDEFDGPGPTNDGRTGAETVMPRLVARRELSFPVSLLLALLRRRLAEFDARGGESRLVMSRNDIVEMLRVFLPENADEKRLLTQVDSHIGKVVDLGFVKRLGGSETSGSSGSSNAHSSYEVRRIIKAFVDAQWLSEFDARLAEYRESLARDLPKGASDAQ